MESNALHFNDLPPELKCQIFDLLQIKDKRIARLVCSVWLSIINESLTMRLTLNDTNLYTIQNRTFDRTRFLYVEYFQQHMNWSLSRNTNIPQAKAVVLSKGNSKHNIVNILRYNINQAEVLALMDKSLSPMDPCVIRSVNWPNLVELRVMVMEQVQRNGYWNSYANKTHCKAMTGLFKALNVPTLKRVDVVAECGLIDVNPSGHHPIANFHRQFVKFLARHRNSLVELEMSLKGNHLAEHLKDIQLEPHETLNLETLNLHFDADHSLMCLNLSLSAGTNLKSLRLNRDYWIRLIFLEPSTRFSEVIRNNRNTLERVDIQQVILDCNWFDGCKRLEYLRIVSWCPLVLQTPIHVQLPALKKLHLIAYSLQADQEFHTEDLQGKILEWITGCMVNLEKLDLELNFKRNFDIQHYHRLVTRLPKLRHLILTKVEPEPFRALELESNTNVLMKCTYFIGTNSNGAHELSYYFRMKKV